MAISNKSLIAATCFLISSLSYAEEVTPLQYAKAQFLSNLPLEQTYEQTYEQIYVAKQLTLFQCLGAVAIGRALLLNKVGKKLIQNGCTYINLKNAPSYIKTPQAMKKNLILSIPVGVIALASPVIFEKVEELAKNTKNQK